MYPDFGGADTHVPRTCDVERNSGSKVIFLMLNKILNAASADVKGEKSPHISSNLDCVISCSLRMALSHRFGTDFKESLSECV